MKSFNYTIQDIIGMHARPAGMLVKAAKNFKSKVTISHNGMNAGADRLLALMGLGVKHGDLITVTVEGEDEETAAAQLEQFFKENL